MLFCDHHCFAAALVEMWRRQGLAVVQGWRRGMRGMASVTSTECGGSGGDKGGGGGGDKGGGGGGDKGVGGGGDKGKHVEVPLPMYGVAGKYAAALYVTTVRQNALDPVRADLEQVAGVAGMSNTLFADFIRDPSVPKPARMKAFEEMFKETKFHDVTKNLISVLAENGRLAYVPNIFTSYCQLLLAHRGEVEVAVTTAMELSAAEMEEIKKSLARFMKKGQNVKLSQKVDRSIIGGIKVDIGDKFIDLSIDRQIKVMEKLLAEAI